MIENIFFKKYLRNISSAVVDKKIHYLNKKLSPQIDCLQCANCYKKLEPSLEVNEIETWVKFNNQEVKKFKQQYIAFDREALYLQTKPRMFLNNFSCNIYQHRLGQHVQAIHIFPQKI